MVSLIRVFLVVLFATSTACLSSHPVFSSEAESSEPESSEPESSGPESSEPVSSKPDNGDSTDISEILPSSSSTINIKTQPDDIDIEGFKSMLTTYSQGQNQIQDLCCGNQCSDGSTLAKDDLKQTDGNVALDQGKPGSSDGQPQP